MRLYIFAAILTLILFTYRSRIFINALFSIYDIRTLGGTLWKTDAEYGSCMKKGFHTQIPLKYYKKFNYAIEHRIHTGDNTINRIKVKNICDEMLDYVRKNNIPKCKARQLPIISIKDPNHKEKINYYIKISHPFVLRDANLQVFENMKFDNIVKLFKEEKVLFSPSHPHCKNSKVDFFDQIVKNKCYVSNITSVFYKHQNLLTKDDINYLESLSKSHFDKMYSAQLFCGATKGSGTAMHSAYSNNFYINVEGEKTWTFVNPNNTPLIYPYFSKSGVYAASESRFKSFEHSDLRKFPLLEYCDHFVYTIKPGEILYNPQSWWHAIYNETEKTVALSTRWSFKDTMEKLLDYHLLRCGNLRNENLRELTTKIYEEYGVIGITLIDEHNILGNDETSNTNIPVWDHITNENHNLCINENCASNWHSSKV